MAVSTNLVDDLEMAFQSCLALLTSQEHFNIDTDTDEMKNNVEQAVGKFLEAVKQLDCFFMQKRVLISAAKPDQCIVTDLSELQQELQRKDALILKHYERLQNMTNRMSGVSTPSSQIQPHPTSAPGHQGGQGQPSGAASAGPSSQGLQAPSQSQVSNQGGQQGLSQGPLDYLKQTTSNIGQSRM